MLRRAICLGLLAAALSAHGQDIPGPSGSVAFGTSVAVLPSGNLVVVDPFYDPPGTPTAVGAVYLYRPDRSLISRLTGTQTGDNVGRDGIVVLPNGNFVVVSTNWSNGTAANAGAVTFINGRTGLAGEVSMANSLVGSTAGDRVGLRGVDVLTNGNYVVVSTEWDNGSLANVGAATWGSGTQGVVGAVSALNSLVGASAGDRVGNSGVALNNGVVPLANGNYVVSTDGWDNGLVVDVGAVTWANGATGISGVVSTANSLVGASAGDVIGSPETGGEGRPIALSNGNYVVASPGWNNAGVSNVGAVTWADGSVGLVGVVSTANSLVGSNTNDRVGERVIALTNGRYVVASRQWDNVGFANAGAVTWRDGSSAAAAIVSSANSLVGIRADHQVGARALIALSNGHFVLSVSGLDAASSASNVGAVIWVDGATGIVGPVSSAIGLTGSNAGDNVGAGLFALTNGNYVVTSLQWANGAVAQAGAVTWRNGTGGSSAVVSVANSLVGTATNDQVGNFGATALSNGNYVVQSAYWNNGSAIRAGAVTWSSGLTGSVGPVSAINSLVGVSAEDRIGEGGGAYALTDGNYVVVSPNWDNGSVIDLGAVTWGNGNGGLVGTIGAANSLVGSIQGDRVGDQAALALPGGRYTVSSSLWDFGASVNARAVTLGAAGGITMGPLTVANSVPGAYATNPPLGVSWDPLRERLAVGRGSAVSFISYETISFDGFE
jgi:hypothetical protein